MTFSKPLIVVTALFSAGLLTACADWRTTPEAVDARWGLSVQDMTDNQTLYPEHGEQERQVMSMDGRKAEGTYKQYVKPPKEELPETKERVDFFIHR